MILPLEEEVIVDRQEKLIRHKFRVLPSIDQWLSDLRVVEKDHFRLYSWFVCNAGSLFLVVKRRWQCDLQIGLHLVDLFVRFDMVLGRVAYGHDWHFELSCWLELFRYLSAVRILLALGMGFERIGLGDVSHSSTEAWTAAAHHLFIIIER